MHESHTPHTHITWFAIEVWASNDVQGADQSSYGQVVSELENQFNLYVIVGQHLVTPTILHGSKATSS